eukprot:1851664-Amphidinium_carterae.1
MMLQIKVKRLIWRKWVAIGRPASRPHGFRVMFVWVLRNAMVFTLSRMKWVTIGRPASRPHGFLTGKGKS